jgi:hypothetical protein
MYAANSQGKGVNRLVTANGHEYPRMRLSLSQLPKSSAGKAKWLVVRLHPVLVQ